MNFTLTIYRKLLSALKNAEYQFINFSDYIKLKEYNTLPSRFIILRHDVDDLAQNSMDFADIQSEFNVNGTFYFRMVPKSFDENIIRKMLDQERFGTVINFRSGQGVLEKTKELLSEGRSKAAERREALISEMIEPTQFLEWFIENWDSSFKQCKEDPQLPNKIA